MINTPNQSMADILYNRLPRVYLMEDDASLQNKPLYRFLQVLSVGFDAMKKDMDNSFDLLDPKNCPDKYLPYLAQSLGIEFPYDMSSNEQRRFIMSASTLYRQKGTIPAFNYLARELTGQQFQATISENRDWVLTTNSTTLKTYSPTQQIGTISSTTAYLPGPNYNKTGFQLFLTANEETQNVNRTYDRLQQLANYFSPAGTKMLSTIVYYYTDTYSHSTLGEAYQFDTLTEDNGFDTKTAPNTDNYNSESLTETNTDKYMGLSKYDDWAYTNSTQFLLNSSMDIMGEPHYTDSIAETQMDVYNSVVGNQESEYGDSLNEQLSNETYSGAEDTNDSGILTETNGVEVMKEYNMWESAFTNFSQYTTNGSFYTNAGNCVDVITTISTGAKQVQLS